MRRFAADVDGLPGAVRAGDLVFVGGCTAPGADGRIEAAGDPRRQTELALDVLDTRLAAAGASASDVVGVLSFHADARQIGDAFAAAAARFGDDPPAWTPVAATALPSREAIVELSAIAHVGAGQRRCVTPDTIAWWRSMPTSAGCRKGELAVIAGQYGSDADGNVNTPGDHGGQARNALNRVKEIAGLLGGGLDDVIEIVSFHQDPRGIALGRAVGETEFFPSRAGPVWTPAGSPALYRFAMLGQYQAIADLSPDGEATLVAATGEAVEPRAAWDAVERELAVAGVGPGDVVAVTSLHKDIRDVGVAYAVMRSRCAPTWTAAGMTGFADLDAMHAFRALAVRPRG